MKIQVPENIGTTSRTKGVADAICHFLALVPLFSICLIQHLT